MGLNTCICVFRPSLLAQMVKNLPAMQETWVQSLGWKDPLEKGMATHSSILAWRIPQTEEPGRYSPRGSQRVRHNSAANFLSHVYTFINTHLTVHLTRTHFIVLLNLFSYLFHQTVTCQRQQGNRIQIYIPNNSTMTSK